MLFGSYSQAFRAPTMGEMYNDSKHFSIPMGPTTLTNYWVPNPNLKPETNETQEYGFGLRFDDLMLADDSLQFKASYFDTKAKDYITPDYTMEGVGHAGLTASAAPHFQPTSIAPRSGDGTRHSVIKHRGLAGTWPITAPVAK